MSQTINVDMTPGIFMPTLYYSQNDVGRDFVIKVSSKDGTEIPAGATIKIQATKPSGFGFSVAGTASGNTVTFTTTAAMTDEAGRFPAELEITKDSTVLGTANFWLQGEPNPHPEGTTDGQADSVIPELTLLVERAETAAGLLLDCSAEATTLNAGNSATASYDPDTGKFSFGIPKGADGTLSSGVLAPTYSTSATYAVGDYVYYSGSLYRCTTAITTAESWTSGHWTLVALANDVSDLKADLADTNALLENASYTKYVEGFQLGYIHSGSSIRQDGYTAVSALMSFKSGEIWKNNNSAYKLLLVNDDETHTLVGGWETEQITISSSGNYYVEVRKVDGTAISSVSGLDTLVSNSKNLAYIDEIQDDISTIETIIETGKEPTYVEGFQLGYIHSGSSIRQDGDTATSELTTCKSGETYTLNDSALKFVIVNNDENHSFLTPSWITSSYTFTESGDFYFEVRKVNGDDITSTDGLDKAISTQKFVGIFDTIQSLIATDYLKLFHTIGIVGDSLSSGEVYSTDGASHKDLYSYSWLSNICRAEGTDCKFFSSGGITTLSWLNDEKGHKTNLLADDECIAYFIALGSNDKNQSYGLGTINDSAGTATFTGYYKQIIELIHTHNPNAPIFCLSLYQDTQTAQSYSDMVEAICGLYSYCYYIDFIGNCDSDLVIVSSSSLFMHNSHYTGLGYIRVGETIKKLFNEVVTANLSDFKYFAYNSEG